MSTRKIIDPKQNGEKVWLKGHAQAIYMSDGSTVEDAINNIEIPDDYVTETELNDKGFLTEHQDISHLASKEWVNSNNYATEEDLSSIEFNSLQNNPIVEDSNGEFNLVDDLGNVGFKVNQEGLFVKDVIAGEHMLSNKADKTYIDDLGVTELNAILVDTDSVADDPIVPDYVTENELEVALKDKQDKLVSGENIKTINGESILGSGDITISGGSSNSNVQAVDTGDVIDDVTVDYATKTYVDGLVGNINSILESIINGGGYGESKPINYGHIQCTNINTYTLQFDLPVTSDLEVDCGDAIYDVIAGSKDGGSYTIGPGESIGNTATVSPDEDETYIYKIIIE
jgi:hypothetical protein